MIDVKPHSIIMLVGPPGCGKTTFAKNVLIPALRGLEPLAYRKPSVSYISSDEIRAELLGEDVPRHSYQMTAMSTQAFEILFRKIEAFASFPVSSEFIIVDTKGLSKQFRERVYGIAKEKCYSVHAILFQYADVGEYYNSDVPAYVKKSVAKDIQKIQTGLRRELATHGVFVSTISSLKKAREEKIESSLHSRLVQCSLPDEKTLLIGDVHGCYDELKEILAKKEIMVGDDFVITQNPLGLRIVLLGDFIDKGPEPGKCLRFVAANIGRPDFYALIGNHERRAWREIAEGAPRGAMAEYFDAVERLTPEEKEIFVSLYPSLLPFVRNSVFIATHSPCQICYAGKLGSKPETKQRAFRWASEENAGYEFVEDMLDKELGLFNEDICTTYHIFGHVPSEHPGSKRGRLLLDGGCSAGGSLCAAVISPWSRPEIFSVPSRQERTKALRPFRDNTPRPEDFDPTEDEKERFAAMAKHGIAFISGTMSPCPQKDGELETIASAADYFKRRGVNNVVMQCKYMGSRCNVYLTHDDETSFAVSRNGLVIKESERVKLGPIFDGLRKRFGEEWDSISLAIIDGELMPWSALGSSLIGRFKTVGGAVSRETMWLSKTDFMRKYAELSGLYSDSGFAQCARLSKKELKEKFGNRDAETFAAYEKSRPWVLSVNERQTMNKVFEKQVEIYGKDGESHYRPFSILKLVGKDGREVVPGLGGTGWNNAKMFALLNDDSQFVYDLSYPNAVPAMEAVFKTLTEKLEFEGVVIKPVDVGERRCVPFMKVRNPKYLTIVYGYDYLAKEKQDLLCSRKDVRAKLRLSAEEWRLGNRMLAIPMKELSKENKQYTALAYALMRSAKQEDGLDPRL